GSGEGGGKTGGGGQEGGAGGGLGERQAGEGGHAARRGHGQRAAERGAAGIARQRHRHRSVEGGDQVARAVLSLNRQAKAAASGHTGRRLLRHHQVVGVQGDGPDRVGTP